MAARHFTIDEANALLPRLRVLLGQINEIRQRIASLQPEFTHAVDKASENGGGRAASEAIAELGRFNRIAGEINRMGCVLKDAGQGLVDFPALRDGREVYLCWRLGEPEVLFWHDLDAGFAGRQPL